MTSGFVFALAAVFIVAGLLIWLFPETTVVWLRRLLFVRRIVFGIGAIILGLFLLSTGAGLLMTAGAVIVLLLILYLLLDPNDEFGTALPWD